MHRNDRPGNVSGMFSMGNPGSGQPATQLGADWPNAVQEELIALLDEAGITPNKADNTQVLQAIQTLIASAVGNLSGTIIAFGGTEAPTGYLECDGSAVSRTTYSVLFAAIGTTWGVGNGTTTFNLPNLARRTLVGAGGSGTGALGNVVGNTGGAESVVLDMGNLPSERILTGVGAIADNAAVYGTSTSGVPGSAIATYDGPGSAPDRQHVSQELGTDDPVSIMQPSAVVMYCIKT